MGQITDGTMRVAPRLRVWLRALAWSAACACGAVGCSNRGSAVEADAAKPTPDASVVGPDASAPPVTIDASVEAGSECQSTFRVTADCKHPPVEEHCANGFCTIPPGCFVMGSPECQPRRGALSEPEVQVTLTHRFELGQHEVTQGEWVAAGYRNNVTPPGSGTNNAGGCLEPSCPVNILTWFDAISYANAMSRAHVPSLPECYALEGCTGSPSIDLTCTGARILSSTTYECAGYRLPTEAEWEYAARAGTRTPYYSGPAVPGGTPRGRECYESKDPNLERVAWYCASAVEFSPLVFRTRPVMGKERNGWGLYDMLGNVAELTSDAYDGLGYRKGPYVDLGAAFLPGEGRTKRGGSASTIAESTTASYRLSTDWNLSKGPGFRLARTLKP